RQSICTPAIFQLPMAALLFPQQCLDVGLDNLARRLVELNADPAHDGRRVGELGGLDDLLHARGPALPLVHLAHAVGPPREVLVFAPLFSANSTGTHNVFSSGSIPSVNREA